MEIRSAKAKGKRLEAWVRDKLLSLYTDLTSEDIRITIGVESGTDIKLSPKAKKVFSYAVECKNREIFKTLYTFYAQACGHEGTPLLIIKMNKQNPLAIIDAEYLLKLIRNNNSVQG